LTVSASTLPGLRGLRERIVQIGGREGIVGPPAECGPISDDRLLPLGLSGQRHTPVVVDLRRVGIQAGRLTVVSDRAVEIARSEERVAPVVVWQAQRLDLNG